MADYLKCIDSEWFRHRLSLGVLAVLLTFVIITARLFYLQIVEGEAYRVLSENNSVRLQMVEPQRGLLFDTRGELLVDNRPSFDVTVTLKDAKPIRTTLDRLSRYAGLSLDELQSQVENRNGHPAFKPLVLRSDVDRNVLAAIEVTRFDLPGVAIDVNTRREYVNRSSAAHLLGYLGEVNSDELKAGKNPDLRAGDLIGKCGIEKAYDSILRGKRGGRQVVVNASGQVMRAIEQVDAIPGKNLLLTIDHRLQQLAETLLNDAAGAVVALDPRNGHVLVLASSPPFNPNAFVSGISHKDWEALVSNPQHPMENKAIQAEYPPASTYKIITAIAGLEEGVIDENTTFFCPGHYYFGNREYRCWKKGGHGNMNVEKALTESCDVFFYQVGLRLGVDRIAKWAQRLGLGSPTGIDMDQEAAGLIPTAAWKKQKTGIPWQGGENLSIAIGQGFDLVTPLQQAVMIAAVANGGIRYKPIVIKAIQDENCNENLDIKEKVMGQVQIRSRTLEIIRKALWNVVNTERGTAWRSRVEGLDICGKTGSAQVIERKEKKPEKEPNKRLENLKDHAWFIAYAPAQNPRIAVAVIVEHGEHGSSAAAPIAKELIRFHLQAEGGEDAPVFDQKTLQAMH